MRDGFFLSIRGRHLRLHSYESSLRGKSHGDVVLGTTLAGGSRLDIVSQSREAQSDKTGSLQEKYDRRDVDLHRGA